MLRRERKGGNRCPRVPDFKWIWKWNKWNDEKPGVTDIFDIDLYDKNSTICINIEKRFFGRHRFVLGFFQMPIVGNVSKFSILVQRKRK